MTLYKAKQFTVDSQGGYLTELTDSSGSPILFGRTMIGDKRRGGSHICLPYFGPDTANVLPQHGFGRDVEWEVEMGENGRQITCIYESKDHELFSGLRANILYWMSEACDMLHTACTITNNGDKAFSLSPGFHPYFAVNPSDVRLNGELINPADFEPFQSFPSTSSVLIESGGRTIEVSSHTLRDMIAWTDMRGDYLCIEPTLAGNVFDSTKLGAYTLQPGETATYEYKISWS